MCAHAVRRWTTRSVRGSTACPRKCASLAAVGEPVCLEQCVLRGVPAGALTVNSLVVHAALYDLLVRS